MKGWTDILYQQVVGFTFYLTIASKNLSLASKNKNQPDYSVINVFAWSEQIGRQHDKGPMQQQRNTFGTGIKIIGEKQLVDPPIDFILLLLFFYFFIFLCGTLHDFACHPCAGAMLIFSVSFQFQYMSNRSWTLFDL